MVRAIVLAVLAALLGTVGASAQGIDCSKARTPVEKAICAAPELIALDRQIGAAYADALARQPDQAAPLRQEALRWLRGRDAACNLPAAQITRCLAGQMTARLAQLASPAPAPAPSAAAPPASVPPRAAQREPAVPAAANPPAPSATIEPAAFPAAEQTDAVLRVTSPGRFTLAAHSTTGVALQLVDQLTGPADPAGEAGVRDGRTDVLLDTGTYRLRAFAAKGAQGEVRLTADGFRDAAPPRAPPLRAETFSAELRDGEQRAFWLSVPPSGQVRIEAAGRALADLRLWRFGRELTALEPASRSIEPLPGHALLDLRLEGTVEPGTYLAVAYGGPALPWADGASAQPFHIRSGLSDALEEGWTAGPVGPFGAERYAAPAFAGVFRVDLPQPAATELRVDAEAAILSRTSREPHAVLRGEPGKLAVVEVRGVEGQPFTLGASPPPGPAALSRPGTYWLSAVNDGAGGDEAPPTVMLLRTDRNAEARIVAGNLPPLAPGTGWHGRFNLRGPTSLLFDNKAGGPVAVRTTGIQLGSGAGGFSHYDVPAGIYVLQLQPAAGVQGVADVVVGAANAPAPLAPPLPPDPSIPLGEQTLAPGQTFELVAQSGPGLSAGLSARPTPVALAEAPLMVTQAPGSGPVTIPVALAAGGTLAVRELGGAAVAFTEAAGRVTLPQADRPRTVVLAWRRNAAPQADIPAPPPLADVPVLRPGTPVPFDLARGERRGFALELGEGGLLRVETLGRLRTSGRIASAFVPALGQAEANGAGENMLLQDWLRAGRYRVQVQARDSAGHLAIAASPAPLLRGAPLVAGSSVRATMPAGTGAAFPLHVTEAGRYRLDLLSLGKDFTVRLDDADGWPVTRPGPAHGLDQTLRPGDYRLLVAPEPVERQVVARLERVREPAPIEGHGPHKLPFGAPRSAIWREPAGSADPRTPDVWSFALAGPAEVTLTVADGMVAEIRRGDASIARLTKRWKGRLEAGDYRVEATSLGRNDRLDYTIALAATELQPGETRSLVLPATIPFALAAPRIATLTTWGATPVKAVLRRADGTEMVRTGARADDWNVAISQPLPAGSYRLELAPALPPSGGSATPQDPGVVQPADQEEKQGDDEDKPDEDDQQAQTRAAAEPHEQADHEEPSERGVDVTLALPGADLVQTVPIPDPSPGSLLTARAEAAGTAVLSLEREDADGWHVVALEQGGAPVVAALADAEPAKWRVQAWPVDGATQVQVQAASQQQDPQPPGPVTLRPAEALGLAVARVRLDAPGLLQVDGAAQAAGWPGHQAVPVENGQAVAQGTELWLLARAPGQAAVRPVRVEDGVERAAVVPERGTVTLPPIAGRPGRLLLWRAASGLGQPGLGAGVAIGSALAAAAQPALLRNASGTENLPVKLALLDLAVTSEQPPGPALLAPRAAIPVRLPGPGQVTATLPPGTAALGGASTVWTGDAALTRTFPAGGVVLLANTTDAPAPATLSWTGSDPAPPLRPGTVFKRFFGASGSFELPVAGTAGARLAVAGDATLEWQGNDGAVRRGSTLAADADGRVVVSYGPGAVVLSLAAPGMSPWPEPTQSTASLPDRIKLAGPAMAVAFTPDTQVLLHATTTAPVLIGLGDRPPELFAAGAEFHRAIPPGPAVLRIYPPHDGPLTGTLALSAEPILPAREGVGASVAVAPGGSAAFGFSLARPATIGVGVRADPDRAEVRVLDAKGTVVGEGVAQLLTLPAGRFVLEARVPPGAAPSLIRPALVGITPRGNGPPAEVAQHYLELVGLKPTEPGK